MLQALQQRLNTTLPQARIDISELPGLPQLQLALINADFPTGPLAPHVMRDVIAHPAYWAFCWGSGLALAQFLLAHPRWVTGRQILDLGSGSGVAGIAAKLAGARRVTFCDTDPDALFASEVNAQLNEIDAEYCTELGDLPKSFDLLLMADVLYDKDNLGLMTTASEFAAETLVADSRIHQLPDNRYREIQQIPALTFPNLGEFDEFGMTHLFHRAATTSTLAD